VREAFRVFGPAGAARAISRAIRLDVRRIAGSWPDSGSQ
jgi:hypothetical protein